MALMNKVKCSGEDFAAVYNQALIELDLSCDNSIKDLHRGCLPIDGRHVDKLADYVEKDVLNYNLSNPGWFLRFATMNVYVLY
jgi:hypothetical protein